MRLFLLALLSSFSLAACAQQPTATEQEDVAASAQDAEPPLARSVDVAPGSTAEIAREAILSISPQSTIDYVADSLLPGFQEVIVGGQVLYVSNDGRYLLQGSLFDIEDKVDLSQNALAGLRRELLAQIPKEQRIIFAPENPRYTVSVFTDVECGYCRKLHQEIKEYNARGIAIEYLAFPRRGLGSDDYKTMVSVWCSDDRNKAMTDAKEGRRVPTRDCPNPIATHYETGQRAGLTGTPMIIAEDGTAMPGYMPPDALLAALQGIGRRGNPANP